MLKPDPPTKDEPAADTAELDQLQGRIRELEAKLAAADLELKKLRATSTDKKTVAEPADKKTVAESTDKKTAAEPADKKTLAESPDKKTAAESTDKKTAGEPADKRAPAEPEPTEVVEAAEVMHGWLLGIDGVVKGKRFGIPARGIKIGRGKRVQILIEDENVSNTHAWVGVEKNRVIVRDQGSTNGTFINDPQFEADQRSAPLGGRHDHHRRQTRNCRVHVQQVTELTLRVSMWDHQPLAIGGPRRR